MADHTVAPGDPPANPVPASATDGGQTPQHAEGKPAMNMMTSIEAVGHVAAISGEPLSFLDDKGNPSNRYGPDLTKATPIDEVLRSLARRKTDDSGTYSTAFYAAARDSGIWLSVNVDRDGTEHLTMMLPCDEQEELRRPRYDALCAHVLAKPRRRQSVIDLLNMLGHFTDNRRFGSVGEAAAAFVAAGGRIYVLPDGRCDEAMPITGHALEDGWNGYPLRRLKMQYDNTLRAKGAREELSGYVTTHGTLHKGSGAFVLGGEANSPAEALVASAIAAGLAIVVTGLVSTALSSETFTGESHVINIAGQETSGFDTWLAALPEADLSLRGSLVADCAVVRASRVGERKTAMISVLTVEMKA